MKFYSYGFIAMLFSLIACGQQPQKEQQAALPHYNLNKPQVFKMPAALDEISGIAFNQGNADTIYAEQDEEGKLFRFHLGDAAILKTKFGKKGDYEDVQVCKEQVLMLRSDGVLYTFPLNETYGKEAANVKEYKELLPGGEYEGLYADWATNKVYILCKKCNEKRSKTTTGYVFLINKEGNLMPAGNFTLNVEAIAAKAGDEKIEFKPSALAKNERTGDWFVLSSVNKMLVIADRKWVIKAVYKLNASVFNQPEGIAFDASNNLYISNEKGNAANATILKFAYQQ